MSPSEVKRAWLQRLTSPAGYANPLKALEDVFHSEDSGDDWVGEIHVGKSSAPHQVEIGTVGCDQTAEVDEARSNPETAPTPTPVLLLLTGEAPAWLPAIVESLKSQICSLAGLRLRAQSGPTAVAEEMTYLDGILRAFWEEGEAAAALYRVRWEHLSFYARGYSGKDPRPIKVNWPEEMAWSDGLRQRVRSNLRSRDSLAALDRLSGKNSGGEVDAQDRKILADLAEAMPWHAFGRRFGRLFPRQAAVEELPSNLTPAWQLESAARVLSDYRHVRAPGESETLVPVEGSEGLLGVICLSGLSCPTKVDDRRRGLAEVAAIRIGAIWERELQESRAAAAISAARRCPPEKANPRRIGEEIWEHMFVGEPVLWARATLSTPLGAKYAEPSAAFPELLPVADFGSLPDAEHDEFPLGAGLLLKVEWKTVPGMRVRRDWNVWIRQMRAAFGLRSDTQRRALEDWSNRELFRTMGPNTRLIEWGQQIHDCLQGIGDLNALESETGGFEQHLTQLLAWRKRMEWQADYVKRRTTSEDREAHLDDVVSRSALVAAFFYYVEEPKALPLSAPVLAMPCHLSWDGCRKPLLIDGIAHLMGGITLPRIGTRYSPEFLTDETRKLMLFPDAQDKIPWAPAVRFALETAFLLAMRHNAKCDSFDLKVETRHAQQLVPDFLITFPCRDFPAFAADFEAAPIQDHLRAKISDEATTSTIPGDGTAIVTLNFQLGPRQLLSLLTRNMRFHDRMLHHHYTKARELWLREKPRYQKSVSNWHPDRKVWDTPLKLGDAIDLLWGSFRNRENWDDAQRECLDLAYIWWQFQLLQSKEPGGSVRTDFRTVDHANFVIGGAFFLYLPEWYEILLQPGDRSLAGESRSHNNGSAEILLALDPGNAEGWDRNDRLDFGHEFRLYFADQGPGVSPADFRKSMERDRPGKFRQAIERARLWCAAVTVYTKQSGGPVHCPPTEELDECREAHEPGIIPQKIWGHFTAKSGFCVEFHFRVTAEGEAMAAGSSAAAAVPDITSELPDLGVIVVDEVTEGHRDLHQAFEKHRFVLTSNWTKFDVLTALQGDTWLWDELLVHVSDFLPGRLEELRDLISGDPSSGSLFAQRGRRARKIILFTSSTTPMSFNGPAAAIPARRLERMTRYQVLEYCDEFDEESLSGKLQNALTENRPQDIELFQRRLDLLHPGGCES